MQLPHEAPVMVLPNAILFPHALLPLYIFEPRYRRMLADVLADQRMFCVAMRQSGGTRETPVEIGGLGLVRACVHNADGTSHLFLEGLCRVELGPVVRRRPYRIHAIRPVPRACDEGVQVDALVAKLREVVASRLDHGYHFTLGGNPPPALAKDQKKVSALLKESIERFSDYIARIEDAEHLVDFVSSNLLSNASARQAILQTPDLAGRLRQLIHFLQTEIASQTDPTDHD
jgi:ATP-dependent Lon protease